MSTDYRVYLSSTLDDLRQEREAVRKALQPHCAVVESYFASESDLRDSCRNDIERCAIYIGILGLRYGYVPEAEWNPNKQSITEFEYEYAGAKKIRRVVVLKKPATHLAPIPGPHARAHPNERVLQAPERVAPRGAPPPAPP